MIPIDYEPSGLTTMNENLYSKTCLCPSEEEEEELTLEYYEVMETEEYMDTTTHDEMDCVNENYICDFLCLKFNYKVFTQL